MHVKKFILTNNISLVQKTKKKLKVVFLYVQVTTKQTEVLSLIMFKKFYIKI